MKTPQQEIEKTLTDTFAKVKDAIVVPKENLSRLLKKLPEPSAYAPTPSPYMRYIKVAVPSLAIVLIIGGIVFGANHNASTQPVAVNEGTTYVSPSDTSDAALAQDLNNVGTQLNGLGEDTANADQALNRQ